MTRLEARELAELRADKAKFTGTDPAVPMLYRWDVAFHQERVRRARFKIDQEALRAYFPTDKSVLYTLKLAERLYGIKFVERKVPVWHEDVRYFDVFERVPEKNAPGKNSAGKTGAFIGGVYLDLYPREGKYNHAAAFPVRPGSTLVQRTPISVLVTNFDRKGLNHDELETLLHEFGHVLHGVLSKTRYADQSGTSVKRDFVEAPSQMFEEWARREEALKLFAEICPECPRLTRAQIEQLDSARKYGQGIQLCAAARVRGLRHEAAHRRAAGGDGNVGRAGRQDAARSCRRLALSREFRPLDERLCGWVLRLHVVASVGARHAVCVRRQVNER